MYLVKEIDDYIFRGNDIRGKYPSQINEEVAFIIGKSFGTVVKNKGYASCVVGRDIRYSSSTISTNLIRGILSTGINVVNLGIVTTPMYYFASMFLNIPSGIMVTASHNPKDENGFKFQFDGLNAKGEEVLEFRDFTKKGDFSEGEGKLYFYYIDNAYIKLFKKSLKLEEKRLKVVLDLANATTCVVAKKIFNEFKFLDITYLYDVVDPNFPNHHPDPTIKSNLEDLRKKVLETGADVGISYDGDGDRLGVIDNEGNQIEADKLMIIFIRDLMNTKKKKEFLYDVKCSKALSDEIRKLGAKEVVSRTGNSYEKAAIIEHNLAFGGEYCGHIFFRDRFPGFDSGIYASLRLIEILTKTDEKLSDMLKDVTKYYSTPEIKIATPDEEKEKIVAKVKEYVISKGYKYLDIDGVRVEFDDSWGLIRASNTGPNLTLRFEATTEKRLEEIKEEFMNLLK